MLMVLDYKPNHHTHIPQEVVHLDTAKLNNLKTKSNQVQSVDHQSKLTAHKLSNKVLSKHHFQSVLMLLTLLSHHTPVESSIPDVEPPSIIVSQLLDMTTLLLHHTSLLKTHGVHLGEIKDIS